MHFKSTTVKQSSFGLINPGVISPIHYEPNTDQRKRNPSISPTTWEYYQPTVYQLYIVEGRTQTEVRELLVSLWDFKPTKRQLITQLGKWGMYKNRRRPESSLLPEDFNTSQKLDQDYMLCDRSFSGIDTDQWPYNTSCEPSLLPSQDCNIFGSQYSPCSQQSSRSHRNSYLDHNAQLQGLCSGVAQNDSNISPWVIGSIHAVSQSGSTTSMNSADSHFDFELSSKSLDLDLERFTHGIDLDGMDQLLTQEPHATNLIT